MEQDISKKVYRRAVLAFLAFGLGGLTLGSCSTSQTNTPTERRTAPNTSGCNANAVIYCGVSTINQLETDYNENPGTHSGTSAAIQEIYASYPFNMTNYDMQSFFSTYRGAKPNGLIYSNGNVVVNGEVVARGALTAGVEPMSCDLITANEDPNSAGVFVETTACDSEQSPLETFVDTVNGRDIFAIVAATGSPVVATPQTAG